MNVEVGSVLLVTVDASQDFALSGEFCASLLHCLQSWYLQAIDGVFSECGRARNELAGEEQSENEPAATGVM